MQENVGLLKDIALFDGLKDSELESICKQMRELSLKSKDKLLEQNKLADGLYILKTGSLQILINGEMVAMSETPESFGEMSCLLPSFAASATVMASIPSTALKMEKKQLLATVERYPRLWRNLFEQQALRNKEMAVRVSELLNNNPNGLVKVNMDGLVTSEYSIRCTKILGVDHLLGKAFAELIYPDDAEARDAWQKAFELFFSDVKVSFKDIAKLMPEEVDFSAPGGEERWLHVSYYPCHDGHGRFVAVDIGIEDITKAKENELARHKLLAEKNIIATIQENPDGFLNLKRQTSETIDSVCAQTEALAHHSPIRMKNQIVETMRKLHTLKGFAGFFKMGELQSITHELESCLEDCFEEARLKAYSQKKLSVGLQGLRAQADYMSRLFDELGDEIKKRLLGVVWSADQFKKLLDLVAAEDMVAIRALVQAVEMVDARKLARNWPAEIARLAERLGKKARLKVEGDEVLITREQFRALDGVLIHLVRNSLDHGLEAPAEREKKGKPAEATLEFAATHRNNRVSLKLADDGRGIDMDRVIASAKKKNVDQKTAQKYIDQGEAYRLLFLTGLTTAEDITRISGRGLGLDAVLRTVQKFQGDIRVENDLGKGCTFIVEFPDPRV